MSLLSQDVWHIDGRVSAAYAMVDQRKLLLNPIVVDQ